MLEEVVGKVLGTHVYFAFGFVAEVDGKVHGAANLGICNHMGAETVEQVIYVACCGVGDNLVVSLAEFGSEHVPAVLNHLLQYGVVHRC